MQKVSQLNILAGCSRLQNNGQFSGISLRDIANLSPDMVASLNQLAAEFKDTSKRI